jgi:septum formation protein
MLILASASPRRLALLAQIGVTPDLVLPTEVDEAPLLRELPTHYATRVANDKAIAATSLHPNAHILAADTVVACGRRILPKTETEKQAQSCLALLSGRRHRVHTAVALASPHRPLQTRLVTSVVQFKRLSPQEMIDYLASGEWEGKAGGYAIQGRAAAFVTAINGSYSNVVGLPLYETAGILAAYGIQDA